MHLTQADIILFELIRYIYIFIKLDFVVQESS